MKLDVTKENAVRITAKLDDFDGDSAKWRDSFYMLFRYQMTWDFAYEITVRESRRSGVFVDMLIKPAYRENILETMDDLGYKKANAFEEKVGIVDNYDAEIDTFVAEM